MKKSLMVLALMVCAAFTTPCYGESRESVVEGNPRVMDTLSYSVGAAFATAIKTDTAFVAFDYDVVQFNEGLKEYLINNAKLSYDEASKMLDKFFSKQLAKYNKKRAEDPTSEEKLFEDDEERNKISYAFGLYWGEEVNKSLVKGKDIIHYYWLCRAFEDVYNGKVALPIGKMILFLKGYQAKDVETKVVDVAQPAVEPQKSEVEEAPKPEVVVDPQPTAVTESK
jgi:hypothetical protein